MDSEDRQPAATIKYTERYWNYGRERWAGGLDREEFEAGLIDALSSPWPEAKGQFAGLIMALFDWAASLQRHNDEHILPPSDEEAG